MKFYRGKRLRKGYTRPILLVLSLLLVLAFTVSGTLAFLIDSSGPVKNVFEPGKLTTTVDEKLEGNVKKNVAIRNDSDSNVVAYIRATWTANWVDEEGNILKPAALGTDYTVEGLSGEGWFEKGGYYYWSSPVEPGNFTGYLFTSLTPVASQQPEGGHLEVIILSQAIQATPDRAIKDSGWPVTVNADGTISAN